MKQDDEEMDINTFFVDSVKKKSICEYQMMSDF